MSNLSLQIINENQTLHIDRWLSKLAISKEQFKEIVYRGIFKETQKDIYTNTFVGTIKLIDKLIYSLPKCFFTDAQTSNKQISKAIQLVENSLLLYKSRLPLNVSIKEEDNYYLITKYLQQRTEFDLYLSLRNLYLKNGIYRKVLKIDSHKTGHGKTKWAATVNKTAPIFSNESPIYVNPISTKVSKSEDSISRLHFSVLESLAKKYHFFDSAGLSALLKSEALDRFDEGALAKNSRYYLSILRAELSRTFKDDVKHTLLLLIEYFEINGSNVYKSFSFFGTNYYNKIWEDALKVALQDQKHLFVDRLAQPVYTIDGADSFEARQDPDILKETKDDFDVIDAKYYVLEASKPGWKDIVKQFFYKKSFFPIKEYTTIRNVFVMPSKVLVNAPDAAKYSYKGQVTLRLDGDDIADFEPIEIVEMNPFYILSSYINRQGIEVDFGEITGQQ